MVVDANSASPQLPGVTYYGIEATHSRMCKFPSPSAPGYRTVSTDIRQWVLDAPSIIQVRWQVEEEENAMKMRNELHERISPLVSLHMEILAAKSAPSNAWQISQSQGLSPSGHWHGGSGRSSPIPRSLITTPRRESSPVLVFTELGEDLFRLHGWSD